jgi:DNA-binding transcriptional MerR regulator
MKVKIGKMSKLLYEDFGLEISTQMLRRMEKKGLIQSQRNKNGDRVYDTKDLHIILKKSVCYYLGLPEDKDAFNKISERIKW